MNIKVMYRIFLYKTNKKQNKKAELSSSIVSKSFGKHLEILPEEIIMEK